MLRRERRAPRTRTRHGPRAGSLPSLPADPARAELFSRALHSGDSPVYAFTLLGGQPRSEREADAHINKSERCRVEQRAPLQVTSRARFHTRNSQLLFTSSNSPIGTRQPALCPSTRHLSGSARRSTRAYSMPSCRVPPISAKAYYTTKSPRADLNACYHYRELQAPQYEAR